MYAAIRPALRSGSIARPLARSLHHRRYRSPFRSRSFHTTHCLAQTPNPPPNTENLPVDEDDAVKNNRDKVVAAEVATERTDAGIASEDPEILAQKLQRSREMTRRYTSALRRTQRRNRAQDMPPIHIPNWFLKYRVKLREEGLPLSSSVSGKEQLCSITITHKESGEHATCLIPFSSYVGGLRNLSEIVRALWQKGMTEEQRVDFALDFTKRIGVQDGTIVRASKRGKPSQMDPQEDSFTARMKPKALEQTEQSEIQKVEESNVQEQNLASEQNMIGSHISPLVLAEIRATIAASLATIHPTTDSFPSTKTNLILHSPSNESESLLSTNIFTIAAEIEADVITLQPQDLAQLIGDYIGEGPEPSPHSIRSLGYDTYKFGSDFANVMVELGSEDAVEDEPDASGNHATPPEFSIGIGLPDLPAFTRRSLRDHSVLAGLRATVLQTLKPMLSSGNSQGEENSANSPQIRTQTQGEAQLEDLKITTFLEALIDATQIKRSQGATRSTKSKVRFQHNLTDTSRSFFDYSIEEAPELDLSSTLPARAKSDFSFTVNVRPSSILAKVPTNSTIIYIPDIKELSATQYGSRIIQKLEDIVRKRRIAGENIMLLGTTCSLDLTPELSSAGIQGLQSENDTGFFRTIVVPMAPPEDINPTWPIDRIVHDVPAAARAKVLEQNTSNPQKAKFQRINLRHIGDMLKRLDPVAMESMEPKEQDLDDFISFHHVFPKSYFWNVMTYDEVHRVALTALGLHIIDVNSTCPSWTHVVLAMGLLRASDEVKFTQIGKQAAQKEKNLRGRMKEQINKLRALRGLEPLPGVEPGKRENTKVARHTLDLLTRVSTNATKHEKRLMPGIANPDQIKTTFDQIHVPEETVEAIRSLTSLSLLRPDAFDYGVLATEKISGALLYGPPGTGKTLLAKAVAKESGSMVLEVSGSSIMDKYVGEGEKNVSAIFSLARKLSPCIVFIDEADAILASRNSGRERTSHRDILNQFLKEWDGLNDLSVFVMVATNRPFDLDDAVIRRLPRRLLVDLPAQEDRREILKIHLQGEQLDESVDLEDISKRTPLYSGSDLKNVVVSAALACVKEENAIAAAAAAAAAVAAASDAAPVEEKDDTPTTEDTKLTPQLPSTTIKPPRLIRGQTYNFPSKRTLHARHFDKALQEISASISEDMSSLGAVKKFDEQYGDRKGRRKKNKYGFGAFEEHESSARVRV